LFGSNVTVAVKVPFLALHRDGLLVPFIKIANHTNIGCRPDCFLRAGKSDFIAKAHRSRGSGGLGLTACVTAKLGTEIRSTNGKLIKKTGNRIPHDFRRTSVRNLERAGVSRSDG
jgi:hypothetical protein